MEELKKLELDGVEYEIIDDKARGTQIKRAVCQVCRAPASYMDVNGLCRVCGTINPIGWDAIYPVGSVYVADNPSTDPADLFGGSWTLFDKELKYQWINTGATFNSTVATDGKFVAIPNGKTIEFRFTWNNKVAINDNYTEICRMPLSNIGYTNTSGLHNAVYTGYSDGLNAIGCFVVGAINNDFTLFYHDWVTRAATFPTLTGQSTILSFVYNVQSHSYLLDSFCDKFYWRRTA